MQETYGKLQKQVPILEARPEVGVVYGEIRLRVNSFWPAVLMHWSGNTIANTLLLGFVTWREDSDLDDDATRQLLVFVTRHHAEFTR